MCVTADIIRNILDAGYDGEGILTVARAMDRGSDRDAIFNLKRQLLLRGAPSSDIGSAILGGSIEILMRGDVEERTVARKPSTKSVRRIPTKRWQKLRAKVFERDEWRCVYCGASDNLTCDHVVPLIKGGTNDLENLAAACMSCNTSKGAKLVEEWAGYGK